MLHQDIEKSVDYLIYYQTEKNEGAKANEWQLVQTVQYVNVYWHNRSKINRFYYTIC